MPQQAVAKGMGHSELRRAQFTTRLSWVVNTLSGSVCVSIFIKRLSRIATDIRRFGLDKPEGHTIHRLPRDLTPLLVGKRLRISSPQGRFSEAASVLDGKRLTKIE